MVGSLQRVEQETVSSQNLANAVGNRHEQDEDRCNGKSTATEGWRATLSEVLVGPHVTRRFRA